ncbi:MAG: aspartate-semialdehyde dehydrogenase, partial [Bdellovibrionales bacterium]|nr:aspartate-semialdehyde dehydrogenase [Bdellovibrionales bacterium]
MPISQNPVIAIVGATGLVGSEMLSVAEERKLPHSEIRLLASGDSAGELYSFAGEELEVEELHDDSFRGVDIALFATSGELSEQYVPMAVECGAVVVDNSSVFRMRDEVPLIVPEVNGDALSENPSIIANPNCTTAQLVPVLKAIHGCAPLKRVVLSTYQSVSGAGKMALDELWEQTRAIYTQKSFQSEAFQAQIAFNCIPQIDVMMEDGFSREEKKVVDESRKILGLPNLRIAVTAVRVPVFHCHAESVAVELEAPVERAVLLEAMRSTPGIEVFSQYDEFPMQVDCATRDEIFVGRVRKDPSVENGYLLWIVADNLRKGAALNAIQIVELILGRNR